jgi:type II secretory ATPase GspE/PulE/Tfp pilus assembly ATPase PilB-like protein
MVLFSKPNVFCMKFLDPTQSRLITNVTEVPLGQYLSFDELQLPKAFEKHFALLMTECARETDVMDVVVLVEELHYASHLYFDLMERLLSSNAHQVLGSTALQSEREGSIHRLRVVQVLRVTHEIIQSIHAANVSLIDWVETQVETTAWALIDRAIDERASDLHIETRGAYAQVFFRIDGERRSQPSISSKSAMDMCNVLYGVHADADNKGVTWNEKTVKDAVIEHRSVKGQHVQLRLSSAPIHPSGNFHVVIRILLMDPQTLKPLSEMGYAAWQVSLIDDMLIGSHGVVFVVGPTNSGKSTSLQSLIARVFERKGREIKVITVERPVEYLIASACQMGVPEGRRDLIHSQSGSLYSAFVAATLRQDPDVVMLGEVNDVDSAHNIMQLVLSGRQTLATLHVYEAFGAFARLSELGVPKSVLLMKRFISGIVFQRLVPLLCAKCSITFDEASKLGLISQELFERLHRLSGVETQGIRLRGGGCGSCAGAGVWGRTLCAEILVPDAEFLSLMNAGLENEAREHWLTGMGAPGFGHGITVLAHAVEKMQIGLLDPRDIERWVGRLQFETPECGSHKALLNTQPKRKRTQGKRGPTGLNALVQDSFKDRSSE